MPAFIYLPQFFDEWCQQGPEHHIALGVGDLSAEMRMFTQKMGFDYSEI